MSEKQGTTLHPCPNPQCSSKVHKVFLSEANLNKHFGAKPACYEYARQMCHTVLKQSAMAEQKLLTHGADTNFQENQEVVPLFPSTTQEELYDTNFPINNTNKPFG
jgi:hypothetical protein